MEDALCFFLVRWSSVSIGNMRRWKHLSNKFNSCICSWMKRWTNLPYIGSIGKQTVLTSRLNFHESKSAPNSNVSWNFRIFSLKKRKKVEPRKVKKKSFLSKTDPFSVKVIMHRKNSLCFDFESKSDCIMNEVFKPKI